MLKIVDNDLKMTIVTMLSEQKKNVPTINKTDKSQQINTKYKK